MSTEQKNTPSTQLETSPVLNWLAWYLSLDETAKQKQSATAIPDSKLPLVDIAPTQPDSQKTEKQLTPPLSKPEIQQVPHDGDKLIMVINFLLREVVPLKSRADQVKLLHYYFKAILSESLFSPFTSLGYSIELTDGNLKLYDDVYQIRPDVTEVCRQASASVTEAAEKRRYELEHTQITDLIQKIATLFTAGYPPQALIELITHHQPEIPSVESVFTAFGWQAATNLITPEAAHKLELPTHQLPHYAGKKIAYLMPQSEVHKGNMSVLVIAQPIFIPSLNRLVLLHDQCFYPADWQHHLNVLTKLGVTIPPEIAQLTTHHNLTSQEIQTIEAFVMKQVVTLSDWQTTHAQAVLANLTGKQGIVMKLKEWWKKQQLKTMEASLHWYAELVVELMSRETAHGPLDTQKITKLSLFLKRIVFAGILSKEKLIEAKLSQLLDLYYQHAHQSEEQFATTAASTFRFSAAIKAIDTSLLECVSVGTINGFGAKQLFSQLQMGKNLTQGDLVKLIGSERAKKWQEGGTCITCGDVNWVGECGMCLQCEVAAGNKNSFFDSPMSVTKPKLPKLDKSLTESKAPTTTLIPTTTVGNFVASLI